MIMESVLCSGALCGLANVTPRREGSSSLLGAFYDQPTIRVLHCTSNRPGDVCKAGEFLI